MSTIADWLLRMGPKRRQAAAAGRRGLALVEVMFVLAIVAVALVAAAALFRASLSGRKMQRLFGQSAQIVTEMHALHAGFPDCGPTPRTATNS